MQYYKIQFDNGTVLLQEVFSGNLLRYCDENGVTAIPPSGGSQNIGEVIPTFTPPPDPVATTVPVVTPTDIIPSTPPPVVAPTILGAPIRLMTYDDKGQMVRIDYPATGIYHVLEYTSGRLSKITEISPIGVDYERHFYYDDYGRFQEETQL